LLNRTSIFVVLTSTSNHDTVGDLKNFVVVLKTLLILDLTDDLNVLALLAKNLLDLQDILGFPDKTGGNKVNVVLWRKVLVE